jgi:hypothetical protein
LLQLQDSCARAVALATCNNRLSLSVALVHIPILHNPSASCTVDARRPTPAIPTPRWFGGRVSPQLLGPWLHITMPMCACVLGSDADGCGFVRRVTLSEEYRTIKSNRCRSCRSDVESAEKEGYPRLRKPPAHNNWERYPWPIFALEKTEHVQFQRSSMVHSRIHYKTTNNQDISHE